MHARVINTPRQHSSGYIAPGAMYQSTSLSMNDVILVVSQHPAGCINMENPPVEIIYHHEVLLNQSNINSIGFSKVGLHAAEIHAYNRT